MYSVEPHHIKGFTSVTGYSVLYFNHHREVQNQNAATAHIHGVMKADQLPQITDPLELLGGAQKHCCFGAFCTLFSTLCSL